MAILDAQLLLSDAQAVTADARSTNVIDLGIGRNIFDGEPLAVVIAVEVAADFTTTDETYTFRVDTDDNAAFSSATAVSSTTVAASALAAGAQVVLPVAIGTTTERYLSLYYDVGGTTPTITVTAFLQPLSMIPKAKMYADNITIS